MPRAREEWGVGEWLPPPRAWACTVSVRLPFPCCLRSGSPRKAQSLRYVPGTFTVA